MRFVAGAFSFAFLLFVSCFAQAQDFKGKTINIVVGFTPGGGYDMYARLLSRVFGASLPGRPNVVVQNMPGAGGLVAMNYICNVAPKDGTTVGIVLPSVGVYQKLYPGEVHYDVEKVNWVGRITSNTPIQYTWHTSKFRTVNDMKGRQVLVAGTGATSPSMVVPLILNAFADTKFKVISGYPGGNESRLALERGEVEAISSNWSTVKDDRNGWLRDNKLIVTLQYGTKRHPELAEIPAIVELVKTEDQRRILGFFASADEIGVAVVAPPFLEPSVVASLREAFMTSMRDTALVDEARRLTLDLDVLPGDELQKISSDALATPAPLIAQLKKIIDNK